MVRSMNPSSAGSPGMAGFAESAKPITGMKPPQMPRRHTEGTMATIDKHDGDTECKGFTVRREAARGSAHDHHFLDPSHAPMKLGL